MKRKNEVRKKKAFISRTKAQPKQIFVFLITINAKDSYDFINAQTKEKCLKWWSKKLSNKDIN